VVGAPLLAFEKWPSTALRVQFFQHRYSAKLFYVDGSAGHFSNARSGAPPSGFCARFKRITLREMLATRLKEQVIEKHGLIVRRI
jgi:hypothetical protein